MLRSILGLLALVVVLGFIAVRTVGLIAPRHIYTVAQIDQDIRHDPHLWAGRYVMVQGIIMKKVRHYRCRRSCVPITVLMFVQHPKPGDILVTHFSVGSRLYVHVGYDPVVLWIQVTEKGPQLVHQADGSYTVPYQHTFAGYVRRIPFVGPLIEPRFPENGDTILTIRVSSSSWCVGRSSFDLGCSDGTAQ